MPDHFFERHRRAGGRVEQRLAFVGGRPLRSADEVLAAHLGRVAAAGEFHQAVDERTLFVAGDSHNPQVERRGRPGVKVAATPGSGVFGWRWALGDQGDGGTSPSVASCGICRTGPHFSS